MSDRLYRRCLRRALRSAWSAADTFAGLLALAAGAVLHYQPTWEASVQDLIWQLPAGVLVVIAVLRIVRSPREVYREDMEEKQNQIESLRQQVVDLQKRLIPWLTGSIERCSFADSEPTGQTIVVLKVVVQNHGAPTVVAGWPLHVSLPDGTRINVEPIRLPTKALKFRFTDGRTLELDPVDYIFERTGTPVPRGGKVEGFLTYLVNGEREQLENPETGYALSIQDNDGQIYVIPYNRGESFGPAHHPRIPSSQMVEDQGRGEVEEQA